MLYFVVTAKKKIAVCKIPNILLRNDQLLLKEQKIATNRVGETNTIIQHYII